MTLSKCSTSVFAPLVFLAAMSPDTSTWGQSASPASYSLESADVVPGEPVFLRFTVHNSAASVLELDLGQDRKQSFVFDVTLPDGTVTSDVAKPLREGISVPGRVSVAAGESYIQTLLLNEWIRFSAPGTYVIDIDVANPMVSGESTMAVPKFVTRVNVRAPDDQRLAEICATLAEGISTERSVGRAMELALALSYARDPIAVPFLLRAYERNRYVEQEVIEGLARISDISAVEALISMLDYDVTQDASWNESRIARARSALAGLERASTEPSVKRTIQLALAENR
jgi:hypothetical protein